MNFLYGVRSPHVHAFLVVHVVHVVRVAVALRELRRVVHAIPAIRHLNTPQTINNVFEKGISFVPVDQKNNYKQ